MFVYAITFSSAELRNKLFIVIMFDSSQDYVPCHEGVASKLSWQMEQELAYPEEYNISR